MSRIYGPLSCLLLTTKTFSRKALSHNLIGCNVVFSFVHNEIVSLHMHNLFLDPEIKDLCSLCSYFFRSVTGYKITDHFVNLLFMWNPGFFSKNFISRSRNGNIFYHISRISCFHACLSHFSNCSSGYTEKICNNGLGICRTRCIWSLDMQSPCVV